MRKIIEKVTVYDSRSSHYKKTVDICLEKGKIVEISKSITSDKTDRIKGKNLVIFPSLVDLFAASCDTHMYEAETLESLKEAAQKGGVGYIAHQPSAYFPVQNRSDIKMLLSDNKNSISQIIPIGNIFLQDTNQLAPMMEMHAMGAKTFSTGVDGSSDLESIKLAMEYAKGFERTLMVYFEKKDIIRKVQMHEGEISVSLGLKAAPKEAEIIAIKELLELVTYTGASLYIYGISAPESFEIIAKFNKKKKRVWTGISSLHLMFDDTSLVDYDTNYKIWPPFRSTKDRKKLIQMVKNGEIDMVFSQHIPKTSEQKKIEFLDAHFGAINLQTSLSVAWESLGDIDAMVRTMSSHPADFLNIDMPVLEEDVKGSFTVFDTDSSWTLTEKNNVSKSKNSPLFHQPLKGNVVAIIGNHKMQCIDEA